LTRPFDKAKYKALLDGLEATELKLSEVLRDNETLRMDSQFFQKEFLAFNLRSAGFVRLDQLCVIRSGTTPPDRDETLREGVILLKTGNVRNNILTASGSSEFFHIDSEIDNRMKSTRLKGSDVLLNIVGATTDVIGRTALVPEKFPSANITQAMVLVRVVDKRIAPTFLFSFLAGRFGNLQVRRIARPTGQYNLNLAEVASFRLPICGEELQSRIEKYVWLAHAKLVEGKALYAKAESILLKELAFKDRKTPPNGVAVKSFAESFVKNARLDAEYYHPEKQQVLDWLASLRGKSIGDHFTAAYDVLNPRAANPKESVINYDLDDALPFYLKEKESTPVYELGSTKKRFKQGDVVISRLRSYLKEIAIADLPETENCVGSSEFIVLRPKSAAITPELLLVYLRSVPVQRILKWCQSGSNHPRFMEEDLLSIKLPDKLLSKQDKLGQAVRKAISLGRESERLLDIAKRGVEIAIEQDETSALKWLKQRKS